MGNCVTEKSVSIESSQFNKMPMKSLTEATTDVPATTR